MSHVDAEPITLGRLCQIERGEGPPPNESERAARARLEDLFRWSPALQRIERNMETARKIIARVDTKTLSAAMDVYRDASPAQQRRMGNMTARQVLALHARGRSGRRDGRTPRASEREHRRTTRRQGRAPASGGDSESEPKPDLDGLRGFRASNNRMVVHVGRRIGARTA
jgi:hypothetical protein